MRSKEVRPIDFEKSKYYPLYKYLSLSECEVEELPYQRIEEILGFKLPQSAQKYRAWWGTHVQSKAWMESGYRVVQVELGYQVTFARVIY